MRVCGVGTLVLWYFILKYQNGDGAIFTCKQYSNNNFTRKTPAGSLLYKIKLILYMQKLVMWQWRHAADRLQLLRAVGGVVIYDDRLGVNTPLCPFYFPRKSQAF